MKVLTTILLCFSFFGNSFAQNPLERLTSQYRLDVLNAGLISESLEFRVTNAYQSKQSGVTHIYFTQVYNGLDIVHTNSGLHLTEKGSVLSKDLSFIPKSALRTSFTKAAISVESASEKLMKALDYEINDAFSFIQKNDKTNAYSILSKDGSSFKGEVVLKYLKINEDPLVLVWNFLIQDVKNGDGWTVFMDAQTGALLQVHDWEEECLLHDGVVVSGPMPEPLDNCIINEVETFPIGCSYCYEVIPLPFESPYESTRQILESPENPTASPFGWHDTETTQGNNVNAYHEENQNVNQPAGGANLNFTGYGWSQNYTQQNPFMNASITNLFYLVNSIHDILYVFGFDEVSGNFQINNGTHAGEGNDSVRARAQFSNQLCNASFPFGPDGFKPLLKMNACNSKDGSFDATVVFHEFGHGVYGRLTGGPNSLLCSVNRQRPTEGYADWLAIMLTMQPGDTEERSRQIAKYFFNQGINGDGVRDYSYSTDMSINPYTFNDIQKASIPHGVGEVWATVLWDMTWELINTHGNNPDLSQFTGNYSQDEGNIMAIALVIEALKIQPCQPGFVDARDALLAADDVLYQGKNNCLLWNVFARRGLGELADQRDVDQIQYVIESFKVPNREAVFMGGETFCFEDRVIEFGGGNPLGGIYSGPGVTDNGDGETYTFNVVTAGTGIHEVVYSVEEKPCQMASSDSIIIEVILDAEAPFIKCPDNIEILIPFGFKYKVVDYTLFSSYSDDCDSDLSFAQNPEVGLFLDYGDYTIKLEAEDYSGNISKCEFILNIRAINEEESFNQLSLFPNPSSGILTLDNSIGLKTNEISFYDINGRHVKSEALDFKERLTTLSIEEFAAGTYFAIIKIKTDVVVKQIIKM